MGHDGDGVRTSQRPIVAGLAVLVVLVVVAGFVAWGFLGREEPVQTPVVTPTKSFEETAVATDLFEGVYVIVPDTYSSTGNECVVEGEVFLQIDGMNDLEDMGESLRLEGVATQCYHPSYTPEMVYVVVDVDGRAMIQP